jgi:hypothetical protein
VAARTAIEWLEQMESGEARADAHLVLARILGAAGRDDEARAAAEEALAVSELIEHAPYTDQARELLGKRELASVG